MLKKIKLLIAKIIIVLAFVIPVFTFGYLMGPEVILLGLAILSVIFIVYWAIITVIDNS
jgi:hypothetical protein